MSDMPADAQTSLLRYAARVLQTLGISHFVTGSQATIVYGEPPPTEMVMFASPEDVILKKMQWFKKDQSDRHVRDILGVLRIQNDSIDFPYIESWLEKLAVTEIWQLIRRRQKLPNPKYE